MRENGTAVINDHIVREYERQAYVKKCLNLAVENDGVLMYLQPINDAHDGTLVGCEALARIRDTDGELIYPDEFIPAAEENGEIGALGEQMFRKACEFTDSPVVRGSVLKWIGVNLAPIQCMDESLADRYIEIFESYNLRPDTVCLGVTEQSLQDTAVLHALIERLRHAGIPFILDNFGSSSSNIDRLKHNTFASVKLDRNAVWGHIDHPDPILPHVIKACHEMGIDVIAEGVEDENMVTVLRKLGCDYFQGFYYSRPIPAGEFVSRYCHADVYTKDAWDSGIRR